MAGRTREPGQNRPSAINTTGIMVMRKILAAFVLTVLVGATASAAVSAYRVRFTVAGLTQTVLAGNPCGSGWLPSGSPVEWTIEGSPYRYAMVGCTMVGATGIYSDWKAVLVPLEITGTQPEPEPTVVWTHAQCAGTYGAGWYASRNRQSCFPSWYVEP